MIGILISDFLSSLAHAVSDVTRSEGYTRRPDSKQLEATTLHHVDVLDMMDCTSAELISWIFHVGLDKLIYLTIILIVLGLRFKWNLSQLILVLFVVNTIVLHQEYLHGIIHAYHHHGKVPKSIKILHDLKILAYPEYHKKHHTQSDRNWGVFIGLFDPLIRLFYPIKYKENIKAARIDDLKDDRLCIPSIPKFCGKVVKDLYYDRPYSRENGWGYCHGR